METIIFSFDALVINRWKQEYNLKSSVECYDKQSLEKLIEQNDYIIVSDYNSVSKEVNEVIMSGNTPKYLIVLENTPEITTGKMLIQYGVKAYGNSRMLNVHFEQLLETVKNNKIWTYPKLTSALVGVESNSNLDDNAQQLINHRLSQKEKEVLYLVMEGYTNNTIAEKIDITIRTVKAHVSSIFQKLHVKDRISLILLLK